MAKSVVAETAESMAKRQREISVSEFFLKNRHLLGFDNPRRALLTTVKEAVDNAMDACEEAGILPEISVDIQQTGGNRFRVAVTDNGPGIVRAQIPKIFAKLLYGSKFHRLRMSRGQQGIGISAAGMYGQLTTGTSTQILSKTASSPKAHLMEVQIDTKKNAPAILKDEQVDWKPSFYAPSQGKTPSEPLTFNHGTCVTIEMEAAYIRGRLSVDEFVKQCAVVNPHLQLRYRIRLTRQADKEDDAAQPGGDDSARAASAAGAPASEPAPEEEAPWISFERATRTMPQPPAEIKPHPHGVELGMLIQMLKNTPARTVRAALSQDFSRVSTATALGICERAGVDPKANPSRIAHKESESLYKAVGETKLMRPPTDCLSPIGEESILTGMKKEVAADFYTAVTRAPAVYRGNPFQIEVGIAYAKPGADAPDVGNDEPVRVMRFANRVPLLYQAGACAVTKAITSVNWKAYGLSQPKGSLPLGPMVVMVHMASVWVPFTSESKDAIAHYQEIIREMVFALQECGRQLSVFLKRRMRQAELDRKRNYMVLYIPHLALGLKDILDLDDKDEKRIVGQLNKLLEHTHLEA
jgi:DNA topoisomerase-6 subunit B